MDSDWHERWPQVAPASNLFAGGLLYPSWMDLAAAPCHHDRLGILESQTVSPQRVAVHGRFDFLEGLSIFAALQNKAQGLTILNIRNRPARAYRIAGGFSAKPLQYTT